MNSVQTTLLCGAFAAISCAAYAVDTQPTALLPADPAAAFKLSSAAGEAAKMSTVVVKAPGRLCLSGGQAGVAGDDNRPMGLSRIRGERLWRGGRHLPQS
jgi:hypothetical protein